MFSVRKVVQLAKALLLRNGVFVGRAVPHEELRDWVSRFSPRQTCAPMQRFGATNDGGYLMPDVLEDVEACFSPGVSTCADFEAAIAGRGIRCFLADYSVTAPPMKHELIHFDQLFVGPVTRDHFVSLDDWVEARCPGAGDLLLQMDIEGAEYGAILAARPQTLRRFKVIIIELHMLDRVATDLGFRLLQDFSAKLLDNHFVVHAHPNNCWQPVQAQGLTIPPVLELTLVRRDVCPVGAPVREFPHPLDAPNLPGVPDIVLPECWRARD